MSEFKQEETWTCRRCGQVNTGYKCSGDRLFTEARTGKAYYLPCPHTKIHNPLISKFSFKSDRRRKELGTENYKEYLRMYS